MESVSPSVSIYGWLPRFCLARRRFPDAFKLHVRETARYIFIGCSVYSVVKRYYKSRYMPANIRMRQYVASIIEPRRRGFVREKTPRRQKDKDYRASFRLCTQET